MSDFVITNGELRKYSGSDEHVIIPEGVTSIAANAFHEVTSVFIPQSVTNINYYAFPSRNNIEIYFDDLEHYMHLNIRVQHKLYIRNELVEHLTIPSNIDSIGDYAFSHCESLVSVVISDKVKSIGKSAFAFCYSLNNVVIGNSVRTIGNDAFLYCRKLTDIIIPASVRTIGESAFSTCRSLKRIVLPEGVKSIGEKAFVCCESLESIWLPDSVVSIGENAFESCENLRSIKIPNTITELNPVLFDGLRRGGSGGYNKIVWTGGSLSSSFFQAELVSGFVDHPDIYPEKLKTQYTNHLNKYKKRYLLQAVEEDNVTFLAAYVQAGFELPPSLRNELIKKATNEDRKKAITWLQDYIKQNVDLEKEENDKLRIAKQLSETPYLAKLLKNSWGWKKLENGTICITKYKGNETDVKVPPYVGNDPVTEIGARAFAGDDMDGNEIESITIPLGVTTIGRRAFANCFALENIVIPEGVTSIGDGVFECCEVIENILFPSSVTHIGKAPFAHCYELRSITIPENLNVDPNWKLPQDIQINRLPHKQTCPNDT